MNDQREHPSSSTPLMSVSQSRKLNLCNRHVCVTDITKKGRCNGRGQLRGGRCNGGANAARSENECPCEPANRDFSACESQILARQRRCASGEDGSQSKLREAEITISGNISGDLRIPDLQVGGSGWLPNKAASPNPRLASRWFGLVAK